MSAIKQVFRRRFSSSSLPSSRLSRS